MPTYEYVCAKCDHQFEKFQSIAEEALQVCPREVCPEKRWGKGKVRRLIGGGAGLLFKGSGFYITDYRSASYKEAAKKDAPAASSGATGSSSSSSAPSNPAASTPASAPPAKSKTK
jgi:putative FmdB family regulatory protein